LCLTGNIRNGPEEDRKVLASGVGARHEMKVLVSTQIVGPKERPNAHVTLRKTGDGVPAGALITCNHHGHSHEHAIRTFPCVPPPFFYRKSQAPTPTPAYDSDMDKVRSTLKQLTGMRELE